MKITIILFGLLLSINVFSQSLEDYIQIAIKNNSEIKLQNSLYKLEKEKENEVSSYKNTSFSSGIFALTPETRVGSQLFKIGASQQLLWFGELETNKNLAKAKADLKQYDIALTKREIIYQVKNAYYQIYQQKAISKILRGNKLILKTYEKMALAALENNRATMSDVLAIRVQKNELQNKIFQNSNRIKALQKNFNRLLERKIDAVLNIPDSLEVISIMLKNATVKKHPSLEKINKKEAVYLAEKKQILIEEKPKVSLGLDYILVEKRSDANPIQNGKDIIMPKVSISVPLFNKKKYRSKLEQVKIKEASLQYQLESQKSKLQIALEKARLDFDNSLLNVIANQKNSIEIQRAINVDLKAYETDLLDYDRILRLQLKKIGFQLMEIDAIKKMYIAKAKIAYLTL